MVVATLFLIAALGLAAQAGQAGVVVGQVKRHHPAGCSAQPCVYIADGRLATGRYKLTGYLATANGDVAPVANLGGPATHLDAPWGIAADGAGNVYVTNPAYTGDGYVAVYRADPTGNIAPTLRIGGGASNPLCYPLGIAVASLGSNSTTVYVANAGCGGAAVAFNVSASGVFELGAIGGSNTGMATPWGIAVDAGGDIYVANYGTDTITVYAPGLYGNVAPIRTIAGTLTGLSGPGGLAIDRAGNLYVTNFDGNAVTVYPPLANGDVVPSAIIAGSGPGLNGPLGIALDGAANIYVTDYYGPNAVVFAAGSNGDVAPIATIAGSKTLMQYPEGIAVLVPSVTLRSP